VSVTLREEHRLRGLGNRVLTKIFGPKREAINEEWRKIRDEGLLISTSNQIIFGSSS